MWRLHKNSPKKTFVLQDVPALISETKGLTLHCNNIRYREFCLYFHLTSPLTLIPLLLSARLFNSISFLIFKKNFDDTPNSIPNLTDISSVIFPHIKKWNQTSKEFSSISIRYYLIKKFTSLIHQRSHHLLRYLNND